MLLVRSLSHVSIYQLDAAATAYTGANLCPRLRDALVAERRILKDQITVDPSNVPRQNPFFENLPPYANATISLGCHTFKITMTANISSASNMYKMHS